MGGQPLLPHTKYSLVVSMVGRCVAVLVVGCCLLKVQVAAAVVGAVGGFGGGG